MKIRTLFTMLAALLILGGCGQRRAPQAAASEPSEADTCDIRVVMQTTMGDVELLLYGDTPKHRDNFARLTREGFYDGVLFHRVINEFMIQGSDGASRNAKPGELLGNGDLGYTVEAEFVYPKHFHKRGVLAAAREGDAMNPTKASSSSQFYIVTGHTFTAEQLAGRDLNEEQLAAYQEVGGAPHLDGSYTVFGEVTSGMEVVDAIQCVATDANNRPLEDVRIISMRVVE